MTESEEESALPPWFSSEAPTNPVSRLLQVLERLLAAGNPSNGLVLWSRAFGVPKGELTFTIIAETLALSKQARAAVEAAVDEADRALYVDPFDHLETVLSELRLEHSTAEFTAGLQANLLSLRFCAALVDAADDRRRVDLDLVEELWNEINELMDVVLKSSLVEPLKSVLFQRLAAVRHTLEHFQVYGLDGLEESLDSMAGALVRRATDADPAEFEEMAKRFVNVVELGHKVLEAAGRVKALAVPVVKMLNPGAD